jgi:hypothetical protein
MEVAVSPELKQRVEIFLGLLPEDGSAMSNQKLWIQFEARCSEAGDTVMRDVFDKHA